MSDQLISQINNVINEHLPQQTGQVLRMRLEQAERDAAEVIRLRDTVTSLQSATKQLESAVRDAGDLESKRAYLANKEREVDAKLLRNEINELKVAMAEQRCHDLKEVVHSVFANSRFKYYESINEQRIMPPGTSYPNTFGVNHSKSVDGEA